MNMIFWLILTLLFWVGTLLLMVAFIGPLYLLLIVGWLRAEVMSFWKWLTRSFCRGREDDRRPFK